MSPEREAGRPGPRPRPRRRRRARFEIGRVIGTGFTIWFGGLPTFLTLALIVLAPYALFSWWVESARPAVASSSSYRLSMELIELLLSLILSATVIYAVFQRIRGRRVGIGTSIAHGLRRLPAVLAVGALVWLPIVVVATPISVTVLAELHAATLVFLVPTCVLIAVVYCGLWVAIPVCVVERPGVFASISRSWTLTRGSKARIFLVVAMFLMFQLTIGLFMLLILGVLAEAVWSLAPLLVSLAISLAFTSLTSVVTAVGYHELRLKVDGVDPDELAAIFD